MTKKEKEAILQMAEELYESAADRIENELNWGFGVCDIDRIKEETEYIQNLQDLGETLNYIEDDELEDWDITNLNLKFLENDFDLVELVEMVEDAEKGSYEEWEEGDVEKIAKEIWDAINPPRRKKKVA